jgi:uncharacterized protein (DUF4415 family)
MCSLSSTPGAATDRASSLLVKQRRKSASGTGSNHESTVRIDDDLLQWFRKQVHGAGGGSYQTLINAALREYVSTNREPLEATLRRVLREELPRDKKVAAR